MPLWWSAPLVMLIGAVAAWWLPGRATGDAVLRRIVVWSFAARVALALLLCAASTWGWPIFRSLQSHGFWTFGIDARVYDLLGGKIAESWSHGVELPFVDLGIEYFLVVAAFYLVFGPSPLHPIFFNCWLGAVNGVLAYLIARQLGASRRAARLSAALVAWWPSSLIWSAQLLKDVLSWSVMLTVLWLLLKLLSDLERPVETAGGGVRRAAAWALLALLSIVLTRLRFYLGAVLRLVMLVVGLPAVLSAAFRNRGGLALGRLGLVVLVVGATVFARTLNMVDLVSPPHPDRGHFRMAIRYLNEGNLILAGSHFGEAIKLNPNFREAYLGLATVKVQQQEFEEALAVYNEYLEHEDPKKHPLIKRLMAKIRLEQGNVLLSTGYPVEAWGAYQRGLLFDSSSVDLYVQSSLALAQQRDFEMALAMAEKARLLAITPQELARATSAWQSAKAMVPKLRARAARKRAAEMAVKLAAETSEAPAIVEPPARKRAAEMVDEVAVVADKNPAPPAPSAIVEPVPAAASSSEAARGSELAVPSEAVKLPPAAMAPAVSGAPGDGDVADLALSVFLQEPAAEKAGLNSQRLKSQMTAYGAIPANPSLVKILKEFKPDTLAGARHDVVSIGGYSVMDPSAFISTPAAMLRYLPRALLIGFLAPFPWQWLDVHGSTGVMKGVAGAETLLIYLLLPALLAGLWRLLKRRRFDGYVLLGFCVVLAGAMSLVVANLGTLFRLRLLFWLPLLIVAAAGNPLACYRRLWAGVRRRVAPGAPGPVTREPWTADHDPVGSRITVHGTRSPDDVRDCRGSSV